MPTKKPNRKNVPLFVVMPPEERERLTAFAVRIQRPFSWLVRDALRVYLDAVEDDAEKLESLRASDLDLGNAGRTVQAKVGRPRMNP